MATTETTTTEETTTSKTTSESYTNRQQEIVGNGYGSGNRQTTAYNFNFISPDDEKKNDPDASNWGESASRSLYNVFANQQDNRMGERELIHSRLWHGVPQLTIDQMNMFEAAYTGHTFLFVVDVPKFMSIGLYENTNLHSQIRNLKAVIERASTGFSGPSNITADFSDMDDGAMRKVSHVTRVTKEQSDIQLRLHEFAGLPVKNALEAWLTGIYDPKSQHGHYFGNLGIPGGWCLANHSMSLLVVQVDPSWQTIQDAAFYYNMVPQDVPFDHFEWTKGEHDIVQDYTITFRCNEERSPMIMYAAERYMNNRILSMVATSVYNSRQFVVDDFYGGDGEALDYVGYKDLIRRRDGKSGFIDARQYNIEYDSNNFKAIDSDGKEYNDDWTYKSAIDQYEKDANVNKAKLKINRYHLATGDNANGTFYYMNSHDNTSATSETYEPDRGYIQSTIPTTGNNGSSESGTNSGTTSGTT